MLKNLFLRLKYETKLKSLCQEAIGKPQDLRLQIRLGDLLAKMGKKEAAIGIYQRVSEEYEKNGFLRQAMGLNKLILRCSTSSWFFPAIGQVPAELYPHGDSSREEKPGDGATVSMETVPERRTSPRYPISIPVAFTDTKQEFLVYTIDLGLGGMKIAMDRPLPLGGEYIFQLWLHTKPIWPKGQVVSTPFIADSQNLACIKFIHLSEVASELLEDRLSISK